MSVGRAFSRCASDYAVLRGRTGRANVCDRGLSVFTGELNHG